MSTPTTTLLTYNFHDYSRRLLLLNTAPAPAPQTLIDHHHNSSDPYGTSNSFDANVIMVLSVLLCALICSLGLNSIIKCALRCSSVDTSSAGNNNNNSTSSAAAARLANTGVKRKALKTFPTVTYSADLNLPGLATECVICLSELSSGDKVRLLPKCNHGFHVRCIDKWLGSHSSCPTCRHCLIETCHKIVGSSSSELPPPQETIINVITIAPLQPEGLIINYR